MPLRGEGTSETNVRGRRKGRLSSVRPWAGLLGLAVIVLAICSLIPDHSSVSAPSSLTAAASSSSRPPVVIIEGDNLGPDGAALRADAKRFADNVRRALEQACVAYENSADSTVEKWGVPASCQVAILPYNRNISARELIHLRAFVGRGGKVIVFYVGPDELLSVAGVSAGAVVKSEREGQFAAMAMRLGTLPALPSSVMQSSWNVRACEPLPGSQVVGDWVDGRGMPSGLPAVVVGERGAFISHVLIQGDDYRKGQLLRAIIGHFVPTIWPHAVRGELASLDAVGRFGTLSRLRAHLEARRRAGQQVDTPLEAAQRAMQLADQARITLARGDVIPAVEAASAARIAAARAFWGAYPAKPGELRGVWMIYRGRPSWEETMRNLRAANINAVMPRFCSAGVAYFPSQYLPHASFLKQNGDQLAQATEAGRKYGIPVHARMLALFVYEAPEGVREQYRKAERLMVSTTGETENWLCPINPLNRQAVLGACLEMARYPVAGIQLDYIRYPWKTYCYCKRCRAKFEQDLGVTVSRWPFDCIEGKYRGRFADWRREQVTSLVRELRRRLREVDPNLLLSAAVFVNWEGHRESFGQDWKAWVDEGLLDFVCPMDYFAEEETFASWVMKQRQWTAWEVPMCVGIGPRVEKLRLDPQRVLTQIELSRQLGGDGWVLFEYDETLAAEHLPVVASGVSKEPTDFTVGPPFLRCTANSHGGQVRVQYWLDSRGERSNAARVSEATKVTPAAIQYGRVTLYSADGWPVCDLGLIEPDQPTVRELSLSDGVYRLCVRGRRVGEGADRTESFVRWSPIFKVRS